MKLFTSERCQPCSDIKEFLRKNNISFTTVKIDGNPELLEEIPAVPTLELNDGERLVGTREITRFFTNVS